MRLQKRKHLGFQKSKDFQLQEKKHIHIQLERKEDDSGKLHTEIHVTQQKNENIGTYHGILHRTASLQHRISGDIPQILPDSTVVKATKTAFKITGAAALAAENAVIRRTDPAHADQRHWHMQFEKTQDDGGKLHTKTHFVRLENDNIGNTHGIFHRTAALRHRITGDIPQILPDSTAASIVKKTIKVTGAAALAAENAVMRRTRPEYADTQHWHMQFQRIQNENGKFHTKAHFVRMENDNVGNYHGVLHRANSLRNRIVGDVPQILPDNAAVSIAKKTVKFTGRAALAAENAVIRRLDPAHADQRHWQLQLERQQDASGEFHLKAHFTRKDIPQLQKTHGFLHKTVALRHRITGDMPSITKRLKSVQPTTIRGQIAKAAVLGATMDAKLLTKTGVGTALSAENVALTVGNITWRKTRQEFASKYQMEAVDDSNRGLLASGKLVKDAVIGFQRYQRQKTTLKRERQRLVQKKQQVRLIADKTNAQLQAGTLHFLQKKEEFSFRKASFTSAKLDGTITHMQKTAFKRRKQSYRFEKRKFKKWRKGITQIQKAETKSISLQKKIVKNSKPTPLLFQPLAYAGTRAKSSAWQKAASADANNDFMRAIDSSIQASKKMSIYNSRSQRKYNKSTKQVRQMQKKQQSMEKKSGTAQGKLKQQENKLQQTQTRKQQKKKQKNHKRTANKKLSLKERFRRGFHKGLEDTAKKLLVPALPLLFGGLIFLLIIQIIFGVFSNSGFIMSTYAARDDALSSAEMYYTQLADNLNKKVLQVGNSATWKNALLQLGVSSTTASTYEDTPTEFIFGQSNIFPDSPDYDFNPYQLWSFLCAYYYDFDAATEAEANGDEFDIPYWEYGDDTAAIIRELFNLEYTFDHHYDNTSKWEELYSYTYDEFFHYTTGSGTENGYGYVDFKTLPSDLSDFTNSKRVYYNTSNGEILNAKKNYKATGWYFQDQRYNVTDVSGKTIYAFYTYDPNAFQYDFAYTGGYGRYLNIYEPNTSNYRNVWIPSSQQTGNSSFCVTVAPYDVSFWKYAKNADNSSLYPYLGYKETASGINLISGDWDRHFAYDSWILPYAQTNGFSEYGFCGFYQKYEWVKDCRLYYTVHQNCTFEEAIRQILSRQPNATERLEYYALLFGSGNVGSTSNLLGNHQTLTSPVDEGITELLSGNWIYNGYGCDMQEWNTTHCDITRHTGIDIIRNSGSNVYAMLSGKIVDYDSSKHTLTLESSQKVDFWYDKERKAKIIYCNVKLLSSLREGDTVEAGDKIGTTTSDHRCGSQSNTSASYDYLHVEVWIKYYYLEGNSNYKAADPLLLIDY
ncbi:peptidoglycan DD-metalloendopeptidase family protein [Ruminococcus sp.]|uniref:peptidoglycan DD-metalloendopeptidase family protein n=1 Tax=Ruminococcus sp. TaxID=41978 RepID=UPI0025DFEC1F|nr:peptidoglycan DD-metalloendopeptidase family protein [Ruminococcus sp.]